MTLHGKFIINDADYSPLEFDGVGVFMAFSGNGAYRNKGACGIIPNVGPLPKGKYYIVDRPKGSMANRFRARESIHIKALLVIMLIILNGLLYFATMGI